MSRKLIHSIRALAAGFGLFIVAMAIGIPASLDSMPSQDAPGIETAATVMNDTLPEVSASAPATAKPRLRRRDARDEMALPFFSFAHVLRRGNGS